MFSEKQHPHLIAFPPPSFSAAWTSKHRKWGWYNFSGFLMLFVIKNKQTHGIIYSKITQEMPLISGFQWCFAQFRFLQRLLVTTEAVWNTWHSMSTASSFLHFDLMLLNELVRGVGGKEKQKSEINLPRVTKSPFLHTSKTRKSPYSGFRSPAPQLGFDTQMPF